MSKHLRKLRIGEEETFVNEYVPGDNITFVTQDDGTIKINGTSSGGGESGACIDYTLAWDEETSSLVLLENDVQIGSLELTGVGSGGCVSYTLDWASDGTGLVLRNSEEVTEQSIPITKLRVASGSTYFEVDTETGTVDMSQNLIDSFRDLIGGAPPGELPAGYTKADVLSQSADAYIDTGLTINGAYEITAVGHTGSNNAGVLFDAYADNSLRQGGIIYNRADPRYDRWWTGVGYARLTTTGIDLSQKFTLKQNQTGVSITQGSTEVSAAYSGTAVTGTAHILLGASQRTDLAPDYTAFEDVRITLSGTDVKHYIACKRNSDGAAGFYETVEGAFKTSNGSAEFEVLP